MTVRVSELEGTSFSSGQVNVTSGNKLKIGAGAALDMSGLDSALQLPSCTTTERDAISSPQAGYWLYNSTANAVQVYNGSSWDTVEEAAQGAAAITRDGSSAMAAADNPGDAYAAGLTEGTEVWLKVGNEILPYEYDPTDRFGTGDLGWAKFDNTHAGTYYNILQATSYGYPRHAEPGWTDNYDEKVSNDSIKEGKFRIGRNMHWQGQPGENSDCLSAIRYRMPRMTKARYTKGTRRNGGSDTADYGTGWNNSNAFDGLNGFNPWQRNQSGYFTVIWSGRTSGNGGSKGNDWMIVDDGDRNSNNYNSSVLSFGGGKPSYDPWITWGSSDCAREYVFIDAWTVWFH